MVARRPRSKSESNRCSKTGSAALADAKLLEELVSFVDIDARAAAARAAAAATRGVQNGKLQLPAGLVLRNVTDGIYVERSDRKFPD